MYHVERIGSDRIDLKLTGKLDKDTMRLLLDEFLEKSKDIEHGRMMYEIAGFELPTLGAIAIELSRLPKLFRLVRAFDRCAVLTEKKWIRTVGEWEGALIPGLEVKGFTVDQRAEAEEWLAGK